MLGNKWKIMLQLLNKLNVHGLDLRECFNLYKSEIDYLSELKSLTKLNLNCNKQLVEEDIESIFLLINLVELDISHCCLRIRALK